MKIGEGWKITIGVIFGVIAIYIGTVFYLVKKMEYEIKATKEILLRLDHPCPQGTKDVVLGGGKTGAVRYCEKDGAKHGKFVRWDRQKPVLEGYFNEGRKHGIWKTFHRDGRIYRVTEYKNGIEISDKIIDPRPSTEE